MFLQDTIKNVYKDNNSLNQTNTSVLTEESRMQLF